MKKPHIDGYSVKRIIGKGGGSTVWLARQRSLDRFVAIKVLAEGVAKDPSDVSAFESEARVAASLKHHGIVQVIDFGQLDNTYYLVMEYVGGYTVGDWVRRKKHLDELSALDVAECVVDALNYAWKRVKVVHCDIKPDNVMVDLDGTVKVADLGLARIVKEAYAGGPTDEALGTPAYISPEQASGERNIDFRADLYSLGAMLYHLVGGRMLFAGSSPEDGMEKQVNETDLDLCERNPDVSVPFCYLVEKMLAKRREDRHASWEDVIVDLLRVRQGRLPAGKVIARGLSTMQRSAARKGISSVFTRMGQKKSRAALGRNPLVHLAAWRLSVVVALVILLMAVVALGVWLCLWGG